MLHRGLRNRLVRLSIYAWVHRASTLETLVVSCRIDDVLSTRATLPRSRMDYAAVACRLGPHVCPSTRQARKRGSHPSTPQKTLFRSQARFVLCFDRQRAGKQHKSERTIAAKRGTSSSMKRDCAVSIKERNHRMQVLESQQSTASSCIQL